MPKWIQYTLAAFALVIVGALILDTYLSVTRESREIDRGTQEIQESLDELDRLRDEQNK